VPASARRRTGRLFGYLAGAREQRGRTRGPVCLAVARSQIGHVDGLEFIARAVAIDARTSVMRMHLTTLVVMALAGHGSQANAQERCPELTRLRSDAAQVIKPITSVAPSDRCGAYIRFAMAWGAIAQYANDHRESCDISSVALSEVETRQREAEKARDNVCAGRPLRPYPADIIER
jgi:hypothetical protein